MPAERRRPLHGLPIAFKDLEAAVGFPCTRGSAIYKDDWPVEDSVLVERIRNAGAIPIGKTNVPEFGMGSHTYNKVYGTTRNPYDLTKSAGGSSGGAGAALAAGLLPIADGSDLGGSLRNPASFNNVVGFRPTVGLVPMAPTLLPFVGFAVKGPMARSVADVALLMSVMAGPDPRDPACYPSDPSTFATPLDRDFKGVRVAWCTDLGGLPLDPGVRFVLDRQRRTFDALGCDVEDACPDLSGADGIFLDDPPVDVQSPLRSAARAASPSHQAGSDLRDRGGGGTERRSCRRRDGAPWRAARAHARFEEQHEFIVCAVSQVPPFDAGIDWPSAIAGVEMEHYVAWMKSTLLDQRHAPPGDLGAGRLHD